MLEQSAALLQVIVALEDGTVSGYAGWHARIASSFGVKPNSPAAVALWPNASNVKSVGGRLDESRHYLGLFDSLAHEADRHHTARQFAYALLAWHKSLTSKRRTMPGAWQPPAYASASLVAEVAATCLEVAQRYNDAMPGASLASFQAYVASLTVERDERRAQRDAWASLAGASNKVKKRATKLRDSDAASLLERGKQA